MPQPTVWESELGEVLTEVLTVDPAATVNAEEPHETSTVPKL